MESAMLNNVKHRNIIAALGLVLSTSALMAKPTAVTHDGSALSAASHDGGFYVGLSGYYMQPNETGLGLATNSWQVAGSSGAIISYNDPFNTNYKWDWGAKIGYDFGCSANTLELEYFHLDNSFGVGERESDASLLTVSTPFFPNVYFNLPVSGIDFDDNLNYKLDQVTFLAKREYQDRCGRFSLTPSFGVRWADMKHNHDFALGQVYSEFDGVGPVLGLDGSWGFYQCLNLVGRFDYSPIIGKSKTHSRIRVPVTGSAFIAPNNNVTGAESVFDAGKSNRVVHNLNAKIGVNYNYTFCSGSQAIFELGWKASEYVNAFDSIQGNYQNTFDGVGTQQFQNIIGIVSNTFSVQGPYLDAVWHF